MTNPPKRSKKEQDAEAAARQTPSGKLQGSESFRIISIFHPAKPCKVLQCYNAMLISARYTMLYRSPLTGPGVDNSLSFLADKGYKPFNGQHYLR